MFHNSSRSLKMLEKQVVPLFRSTQSGALANMFAAGLAYLVLGKARRQRWLLFWV